MEREKIFIQHLQSQGERVSSGRLAVFRALARKSPLTSAELVEVMGKDAVDPATVYRTLILFRRMGLVRDIVAGGRRMVELSDDFHAHHHHFHCTECGRLQDFDSPEVEKIIEGLSERLRIQIKTHQLEISGVCAGCHTPSA